MAVHRRRRPRPRRAGPARPGNVYHRSMSGQASVTSRVAVTGAVGAGGDLGAAAALIAEEARRLAAAWSEQIPGAISVRVHGSTAEISCQVGPAYPNEIAGVRHPVFGPTADRPDPPWVTNQFRPFLAPAADAKADAAMARYADKIDGWARRAGYR